ncbi:DUF6412 domain-containing protein [Nocardia suismassiliense]|uniref:DUF6412 domain-containing protein n=1 Tax=Nocardia suismassiliense TaxID=2077092 RepID=A0ABW6R8N8_9NOCA
MCYGWRNGAEVLFFLLSWATAALVAYVFPTYDGSSMLMVGLLVTIAAVAALVLVNRAGDLLFGWCRTTRGPTADERRLHGSFRRHSHPDTAGRPRPRAPGVLAGATLSADF